MTRRLVLGGGVAALFLALLTGCVPGVAGTAPTSTPTPAPTSVSTPAPTPEPIAESSHEPVATCDTVLTEAEYASLAEDGLVLDQEDPWVLGPAMEDLAADGALTCVWHRSGGDVSVWFLQLPEDDTAWSERRAELGASGWTVSDDPMPGTLLAGADYDANYQPSMLHADGVTYFVSYGHFLNSVAALG